MGNAQQQGGVFFGAVDGGGGSVVGGWVRFAGKTGLDKVIDESVGGHYTG